MEAGQEMLLAEVLSPSQVSQFLNCPAKWMFRYLLDLKEPGTAATALGRAFHGTIAQQFPPEGEDGARSPSRGMPGLLPEAFRTATGGSQATEGRTSHGTARIGSDHGHKIHRRCRSANPARRCRIQSLRRDWRRRGVKVSGYVDLLDTEGRIVDSKSA